MKQAELVNAVMEGQIVVVGQYVKGRAEDINVRDKATGGRRPAAVSRETVMTGTDPVVVTAWLSDGKTAADWKPSAIRGDKVVVLITSMAMSNGIPVLSGRVEKLS